MVDVTFDRAYPLARRAAQVHAAAAVVASALSFADRADLAQEALLDLWRALPKFDPARASLRTFAERVVASRIASVVRARLAIKRTPVPMRWRAGWEHPGSAIELRLDVERALAVLRDGDRRLAGLLADYSPADASRMTGVSRSAVYEAIGRIRIAFLKAGLGPSAESFTTPKSPIKGSVKRATSERLNDSGREYLDQVEAYKSHGAGDKPDAGLEAA